MIRLKLVLEGTNDGFWDWDIVSDKLYCSPHCLEILGLKHDESEYRMEHVKEKIQPDDIAGVVKCISECMQGGSD